MSKTVVSANHDTIDQMHLEAFDYPQRVRRTTGPCTSFAVSFSFISVESVIGLGWNTQSP
jgi:hypothetical protein